MKAGGELLKVIRSRIRRWQESLPVRNSLQTKRPVLILDKKVAKPLAGNGDLTESEIVENYFLPAFFAAQ